MISVQKILSQLFQGLNPRQREVLGGRFGLEGKGEEETLAALGERYGITRERVRQIEEGALDLLSRKIKATPACAELFLMCQKYLRGMGGIAAEENFLAHARTAVEGLERSHLKLFLEANPVFYHYGGDREFSPFFYLDKPSLKKMKEFIAAFVKFLKGQKEQILEGNYEAHLSRFIKQQKHEAKLAQSYLSITRRIHTNPFGDTGLAEWPEIRPKTIRDRIYLVLKKKSEPLHFRSITEHINEARLGNRKALSPTVHNELIKDPRFVLVGRGVYGLAEDGYQTGTAKEVIQKVLKDNGPLDLEQVVAAVQKDRLFKPNTILANLQRRDFFERLDNGTYRTRES